MPVLERSKITVGKRHFYKKKKIAMKVLGMCVPFIRRYFQEHQFLVLLKHRNIDSVIFRNAGFEEINNHSLRTTPFQKKNCYGTFRHVSTLRKKLFLGALVNCVFLYGSNNSDSVVFGNASFGMIKDHIWEWHFFQKKLLLKFWVCVYLT